MQILVRSLYFAEGSVEQAFDVLILQSRSDYSLSFYFDQLPAMNPRYVEKLKEKWGAKEETEL